MEELIDIGYGKYKKTIKGKHKFGKGDRTFNADALLKGPALRCQDKDGHLIDFHLGTFEVIPDKQYAPYLWRQRNFKHVSHSNSPLGYRLASDWEVAFLKGNRSSKFVWPRIASFNATEKVILTKTAYDLDSADAIPLELNQYNALANNEAITRLTAEFEAYKKEAKTELKNELKALSDKYDKKLLAQQNALKADYQKEIKQLENQYKQELDKQQKIFEDKLEKLSEINDALIQENKKLKQKTDDLKEKLHKATADIETINKELQHSTEERKRLGKALEKLTKDIKEMKSQQNNHHLIDASSSQMIPHMESKEADEEERRSVLQRNSVFKADDIFNTKLVVNDAIENTANELSLKETNVSE
jgi:hypothetical protein